MRVVGYVRGEPVGLEVAPIDAEGHLLEAHAASEWVAMAQEAEAAGVTFVVNSAFRNEEEQARLWARYQAGTGAQAARPGWSTHQSGRSVDVSTRNRGRDSAEFKWLAANAHRFGFVNDVSSEPWHWTYYGRTVAMVMDAGASVALVVAVVLAALALR